MEQPARAEPRSLKPRCSDLPAPASSTTPTPAGCPELVASGGLGLVARGPCCLHRVGQEKLPRQQEPSPAPLPSVVAAYERFKRFQMLIQHRGNKSYF